MGKLEIKDKLEILLDKHLPFTQEAYVIYLLVEIRKILERDENKNFPLLKFYRDWAVHTRKEQTNAVKHIMQQIYDVIILAEKEKKMPVIDFIYMEELQNELKGFFNEYHLSNQKLIEENNWKSFVLLLISILSDQPLINPLPCIKEFSFSPFSEGSVNGSIIYINQQGKLDYYSFGINIQ